MGQDRANIFKLSEEELNKYNEHEFDDCMPGAKEFAEGLKCAILTNNTPYVLLLEDNFGMGKTHFSTRFTKFLRNCSIDTIYFSAWENDYIAEPFVSFSKEIVKYIKTNTTLYEKFNTSLRAICGLLKNLAKATTISGEIGLPEIGKIKASIDTAKTIDACENFLNTFIDHDDYLQKFKTAFKDFIDNSLQNHKLVLIVDELDRCRPDYAMKILEIIKHFFDIEGLFIVIPTNKRSLETCVKALYGIDECQNYESYFKKFFTEELSLFRPNYIKLVKNTITQEKVQSLIDNQKIVLNEGYNSLNILQEKIAEFAQSYKLTVREVVRVCDKAIHFCHHISGKLDCEYLAYLLCLKMSRVENPSCSVQADHPLNTESKKKELLRFIIPKEVYTLGCLVYEQVFRADNPRLADRTFNSYKEFYDLYEELSCKIFNFDSYNIEDDEFKARQNYNYNFRPMIEYLINKKEEIEKYQSKWGSDDNDLELEKYYSDIVENEPYMYSRELKL